MNVRLSLSIDNEPSRREARITVKKQYEAFAETSIVEALVTMDRIGLSINDGTAV